MLKISKVNSTALRLEGRVVGPWVGELQRLCELVLNESSRLKLDLADVSFADEPGLALLTNLTKRGVELLNLSPFLEAQLQTNPGQ